MWRVFAYNDIMRYTKPPLNFNQQAKLLIRRGLVADEENLETFLGRVNYYRFTGYLYPFRLGGTDNYLPGTTLDQIKEIYYFDTDLRLLTLSTIEVIDITLFRTQMVEKFSLSCGAFCYTDLQNFGPSLPVLKHQEMMTRIQQNIDRSAEEFVGLYRAKYTSEKFFPFWMIAEASTFGQLSLIFRYLPRSVQVPIAKQFNLHSQTLVSWLHTITTIRNICAHHSRLWNRILPVKPSLPSRKHHPEFYTPSRINNDSYFVVFAILKFLLDVISPKNSLRNDFIRLLSKYPGVPKNKMGFPINWQDYQIFQ
jgi:abortive infection bacteriophage resistance protein